LRQGPFRVGHADINNQQEDPHARQSRQNSGVQDRNTRIACGRKEMFKMQENETGEEKVCVVLKDCVNRDKTRLDE